MIASIQVSQVLTCALFYFIQKCSRSLALSPNTPSTSGTRPGVNPPAPNSATVPQPIVNYPLPVQSPGVTSSTPQPANNLTQQSATKLLPQPQQSAVGPTSSQPSGSFNQTSPSLNGSSFQMPRLTPIAPLANSTNPLKGNGSSPGPAPPIPVFSTSAVAQQAAFDKNTIPPRPVHASGAGAYGTFTVTTNFAQSKTMMDLFSSVGKKTPVMVRLSNALGEKGSYDTARNVRGFAIKFETSKGPWDLTLNNAPMFFIRDPTKFPPLIQSQSRNPQNNLPNADTAFNYFPTNPETMNLFLRIFSSAGTSNGWLNTNAYSVNTYRWYTSSGDWSYVRITLQTNQGVLNLTSAEQAQISNPSFAAQDLYAKISSGNFPRWTMYAQILSPKDAENFRYNALDVTKEWPDELVKPQEIGVLELNKNPLNYFTEVEKAAFSPTNVIPGWDVSQDPILQMRLFAYKDSEDHRLGKHNNPLKLKKRSLSSYPVQSLNADMTPQYDAGHVVWLTKALQSLSEVSPVDFEQPSFFYGNLSQAQKSELIQNIAGGLSVVSSKDIRNNLISWLGKSNTDLPQQVTNKLTSMTGGA